MFFFSSRRRHTRFDCDWSSDVCSSDLVGSSPEYIKALTSEWKGERFPDGRPRVSDAILERLKNISMEEARSEEHTSELQSQSNLVCRLLLEKKKKTAWCSPCRGRSSSI